MDSNVSKVQDFEYISVIYPNLTSSKLNNRLYTPSLSATIRDHFCKLDFSLFQRV